VKARVLARAPVEILYELARDTEEFKKYAPAIKEIKVLQRSEDGNFVQVEWTAHANFFGAARTLTWVQNDEWDNKNLVCRFCLCRSNDMKKLAGEWEFKTHPKGTEMIFSVNFQVHHPLMTPLIHRILDQIMRKNNEAMLNGLKKKAEQEFWTEW